MTASEVLIWIFATSWKYSVELYVGFIWLNYFEATNKHLVEAHEFNLDLRKLDYDFERVYMCFEICQVIFMVKCCKIGS